MKKKWQVKQVSQILCFFSMGLAFYAITWSAILSLFGKEALSEITITVVGVLTAIINSGYFALSGARDLSKNKHDVKENDL